jgi:hypothetical protein
VVDVDLGLEEFRITHQQQLERFELVAAADKPARYVVARLDLAHDLDVLRQGLSTIDALRGFPSIGICSRSRRKFDRYCLELGDQYCTVEEYLELPSKVARIAALEVGMQKD